MTAQLLSKTDNSWSWSTFTSNTNPISAGVEVNTSRAGMNKEVLQPTTGATAYVARTSQECNASPNPSRCYFNQAPYGINGQGTGLRSAILASSPNDEIVILNNYTIHNFTVLIDKPLTIRGHDQAMITYEGNICDQPMLSVTSGVVIRNLTITDGTCNEPSRNLIVINSPSNVRIENNTLLNGNRAVSVQRNNGNVTVAFNHIANHSDFAIFYQSGGTGTGRVDVFANNILNNGSQTQVNCNNRGTANHNYWGLGLNASDSVLNCTVNNAKQLGAPIRFSEKLAGVDAVRQTVTPSMTYLFDEKVGVQRSDGSDFEVIIVNHGHGLSSNIPFYQTGFFGIRPCSNFYDVFLAGEADATDLTLALKYDLNENCVNLIESNTYCLQPDSANYPLWWYDPEEVITDGWTRTGQNPQGPGAGNASGQVTTCNTNLKEIRVIIDNSGRPGIVDLRYTPFFVGLPRTQGVVLSQFTAQFEAPRINLRWTTSSEVNARGFRILRSPTRTDNYVRISPEINAIGDTNIGGIYNYADSTIALNQSYYYQIEVINREGIAIETHGPLAIYAATPTPTITPSPTTTTDPQAPSPTATLYFFRSPTVYFIPNTPTPTGGPTQVRTEAPTPTGTRTFMIATDTADPQDGYPIDKPQVGTPTLPTPPLPSNEDGPLPTITPSPQISPTPAEITEPTDPGFIESLLQNPTHRRWVFFSGGLLSGLGMLAAASIILAKIRFS